MTKGILISRANKVNLSKTFHSNPSPINEFLYKLYRNSYNTIIRASKKMYFETELIKNQSNMKKTWVKRQRLAID